MKQFIIISLDIKVDPITFILIIINAIMVTMAIKVIMVIKVLMVISFINVNKAINVITRVVEVIIKVFIIVVIILKFKGGSIKYHTVIIIAVIILSIDAYISMISSYCSDLALHS